MKHVVSKNSLVVCLLMSNLVFASILAMNYEHLQIIPPHWKIKFWNSDPSKKHQARTAAEPSSTSDMESRVQGYLREAMLSKNSQLEACYEDYLRHDPKVQEGHISVGWKVNRVGDVIEPMIRSKSVGDEQLESCLIDLVRSLSYGGIKPDTDIVDATPEGMITVAHRFTFKRRSPSSLNFE